MEDNVKDTFVKEVVVKGSTELFKFDVEAPALKQKISMRMTLPSLVIFNPFTNDKITLGGIRISKDDFVLRVKNIIADHNRGKHQPQQITLKDEAIHAIYDMIKFVDYKIGQTIQWEFPISPRWFKLKIGKYGFKWKNKLGAGVFITSKEPFFTMKEFDHNLLGLRPSQFTYLEGSLRWSIHGQPIFDLKEGGRHWLVKNIIRNSKQQLKDIENKYYRFCKDGNDSNEYAIIDAIVSNDDIKIESIVIDEEKEAIDQAIEQLVESAVSKAVVDEMNDTLAKEAFEEKVDEEATVEPIEEPIDETTDKTIEEVDKTESKELDLKALNESAEEFLETLENKKATKKTTAKAKAKATTKTKAKSTTPKKAK